MRRRASVLMKTALGAWRERMEVLRCCEQMGASRMRRIALEHLALSFQDWSQGAAQQRLAKDQVRGLLGIAADGTTTSPLPPWSCLCKGHQWVLGTQTSAHLCSRSIS